MRYRISRIEKQGKRAHRSFAWKALVLSIDLVLALAVVFGYYEVNYVVPHDLGNGHTVVTDPSAPAITDTVASDETGASPSGGMEATQGGTFTDTVVSSDDEYHSPDVSVSLTHASYDSGIVDNSANGVHARYGTNIAYTLADIYVKDVSSLRTAFAKDTYGVGYTEPLSSMSARVGSILAVNGDSYSNNRHANNGIIIRDGVIYRAQPSTEETCVLYRDGTMKILPPGYIDINQLTADGAWQTWVFGPSLLDDNGTAKTRFTTWSYITQSHPRTAIGYYGPGHYCLLVVDGREPGTSRGMYLSEMSKLFSDLGCKAAYNLDGGHCSSMTKGTGTVSRPYKVDKDISDGIFICEPGGAS